MVRHHHLIYILCSLAPIFIITNQACSAKNTGESSRETPQKPTVFMYIDYVIYTTMEELTDNATIIIMGSPVRDLGIVNLSSDPHGKPILALGFYDIHQMFEVEVSRYIKGEGPDMIYVAHGQGMTNVDFQELSENDIYEARQRQGIVPLSIDQRYIMFLRPPVEVHPEITVRFFLGIAHPWRFAISDTDCVLPEDEASNLSRYFHPTFLDQFIQYITDPATFPVTPYPPPLSPIRCPGEYINNTPYP